MEINLVKFTKEVFLQSKIWISDTEISKLIDAKEVSDEDSLKWFLNLKNIHNYKIWGVSLGDNLIGVCGLKNINSKNAEYFGYIGDKTLWGKGLGQQILNSCMIKCKNYKLESMYLYVKNDNLRAIRSYEKFGFNEVISESMMKKMEILV